MPGLLDFENEFHESLTILEKHTSFAELMAERSAGYRLRFDASAVRPEPQPRMEGVVFRAWAGDRWVESATAGFDRSSLRRSVAELAQQLARSSNRSPPPGVSSTETAQRTLAMRRSLADTTLEDRIARAKLYFSWATSVPGIENAVVNIFDAEDERLYLSSAGAKLLQHVARAGAVISPLAIESGKVEYDFLAEGRTGGFEVLDSITEDRVLETAKESRRLLTAEPAPSGRVAVLMDPSTAGTFAHESFGHGTEADQMLRNRSYLKPLLGQTLGPECLTLVDDGSLPGGWGSIFFDDEGHPAEPTIMVDRGRFVEVLHDRESAAVMGRRARGNTRRSDFLSRPFVRMTNTFVEPGDWTLDELLQEANSGVLLESCMSGIEDPLGGQMQIGVRKAHSVEHGQVTKLHSSMTLSGRVLDVLRSVKGVSRKGDFAMSPGFCGKGHSDLLPAGTGGPYVLSEAVVGPA